MEYVDGFVVENLAIDGNGIAAVGINVDKTGAGGTVNTTDGIFRRLFVHGNASGGASNANWEGIVFSNVSGQNVEDMRVFDSTMYCGPSSSSGVAGIVIGASPNAKNFQFIHNEIHQCAIGVWQRGGAMDLEYSELGNNTLDVRIDATSDPNEHISNNLSESQNSGEQFLRALSTGVNPVDVSHNTIPVNDVCAVELGSDAISLNGNYFYYSHAGTTPGTAVCNTSGKIMHMTGDYNGGALSIPSITSDGLHDAISIETGYGPVTTEFSSVLLSNGSRFIDKGIFFSVGETFLGFTPIANGVQNAIPCKPPALFW